MVKKENTHVTQTEHNKYPKQKMGRDPEARHRYVTEIKILTPEEYRRLYAVIPQERHRVLLDILLITGMRYVEVRRLFEHPEWYNEKENHIHLPAEAQRKAKRVQPERTIHPLPGMFKYLAKTFFGARSPPDETNWNKDLQKWAEMAGMNSYGFSAKMTRKTIESWQIASGVNESKVCLRHGHNTFVSMRHYQGLVFNERELSDIKKLLVEWGMLK